MSELLSKVTVIVDGDAPQEMLAQCISCLQPLGVEILLAAGAGSICERWNDAAKQAKGDYLFFVRPWVLIDPDAVSILAENLEREMEIGICVPMLFKPDGEQAPQEFVILEDECKRRPLDVLLRPVKYGERPEWLTSPQNGISFLGDATMVRKVTLWGVDGWQEGNGNSCLGLELGLSVVELNWRVTCDHRAVAVTNKPCKEDAQFDLAENIRLVERWYGRFLPHGLRTSDGVIRNHPWVPVKVGATKAPYQLPPSPFTHSPRNADQRRGDIPGERCSVVVVTYNSMGSIEACLTSVLANLGTFDELIFVDNASRDDTPKLLSQIEHVDPRIRVVLNSENLGFSEGCNLGIAAATGDYIVLLNPDTVVTEGWLARMRHYFQDPSVGAVGPISNGAYGMQGYSFHFPRNAGVELSPADVHDLATRVNARRGVESKLLIGFCMMIPRRVLDKIGLLDVELFLGCDDLDISWRLREAGYRLLIATDVFVLHRVHVSFGTEPESFTQPLLMRSANAFAGKLNAHYGVGKVPDQLELWGIDWFESEVEVWPKAA